LEHQAGVWNHNRAAGVDWSKVYSCPLWVKNGKAQGEHMFSVVHPTTDIDPRGAEIKNSAPHLEP
jgi:hypothetical protein